MTTWSEQAKLSKLSQKKKKVPLRVNLLKKYPGQILTIFLR